MWNHCRGIENPADIGSRKVLALNVKGQSIMVERTVIAISASIKLA